MLPELIHEPLAASKFLSSLLVQGGVIVLDVADTDH